MSTASSLQAQPLDSLVEDCVARAQALTGRQTLPTVIVSPYRFNPLGAHIDHQGGSVLARCLDQYTILCFWPTVEPRFRLHAGLRNSGWETTEFGCGELDDQYGWDAMPRAAAKALDDQAAIRHGWEGVVFGTLVSGGLSSSASVILTYLSAMADTNERVLTATDQVELCRIVENDYRGLNNGIQDQMSIAFGRAGFLSELDVNRVEVKHIADPVEVADVCFLLCFSGVTRDLTGSQFNNRVAQCQEAASLLQAGATRLGDVETDLRHPDALSKLPVTLRKRALHVFTEMQRVQEGIQAWQSGNWQQFGSLMNASCQSSIMDYESGSEWLIALHDIASAASGVLGNRFSGGGYGGCLFMLVNRQNLESVADTVTAEYHLRYPMLADKTRVTIAASEGTVRRVVL